MAPKAYKVFSTLAHEILGRKIISRLLHARSPHLGGMNGDVKSDLSTLEFKSGEKIEDIHRIILILQQEIILFEEIVSPKRLLFQ